MKWEELDWAEIAALLGAGCATPTGFLDSHQWIPLARAGYAVEGGHPNAQFRRACRGDIPPGSVLILCSATSPDADSVARGLRAKLANLAGGQSCIGDLLLLPAPCIACLPEASPALQAAGWQVLPQWPDDRPAILKATIAAPRLDAAVAGAFRLSRGEAQTAIEYGFVFHNFRLAQRRNLECRAGDQLIFTGKGRAELVSLEQPTRAGRLWLEFRRYPV